MERKISFIIMRIFIIMIYDTLFHKELIRISLIYSREEQPHVASSAHLTILYFREGKTVS